MATAPNTASQPENIPNPIERADHGTYTTADPSDLDIGPNVRGEADLDPHFCADVRDHGVEVAIVVRRRGTDGPLVVRDGQRRTLAARKAHLGAVPILIQPGDADEPESDPTAHSDRIVSQLRANRHRRPNTPADEAVAAQQLLGLGYTDARIARETRIPAATVRAATAAARSEFAVAALRRYDGQLTLDQAAVLAEFDGDPDTLKEITLTALERPERLDHHAQRLRDDRDIERLREQTEQTLREQGVTVVGRDHDGWQPLYRLRCDADDTSRTGITEDRHRDCPGHSALVDASRHWQDGLRATQRWGCADPDGNGHEPLYREDGRQAGRGGPMTEAEKTQRRLVIANNKAWDSAETVRRRWLREFLARTKPPADAAVFVAASLGHGHHCIGRALGDRNELACSLLQLDGDGAQGRVAGRPSPIALAAQRASAPRATMIALAVVVAAFDASTGRHTWRHPDPVDQRYLRQLQTWGYELSDVEQLVLAPESTS